MAITIVGQEEARAKAASLVCKCLWEGAPARDEQHFVQLTHNSGQSNLHFISEHYFVCGEEP